MILTKAIQKISEHAAKGKAVPLDQQNLLRLFEVVGNLAQEASRASEPDLKLALNQYSNLKSTLRSQVLKGISPPTLTIPLLETEIFTEDLFPKEIVLKVDELAQNSDTSNKFPALGGNKPWFKPPPKRQREESPRVAPLRKKTKPVMPDVPTTSKNLAIQDSSSNQGPPNTNFRWTNQTMPNNRPTFRPSDFHIRGGRGGGRGRGRGAPRGSHYSRGGKQPVTPVFHQSTTSQTTKSGTKQQ